LVKIRPGQPDGESRGGSGVVHGRNDFPLIAVTGQRGIILLRLFEDLARRKVVAGCVVRTNRRRCPAHQHDCHADMEGRFNCCAGHIFEGSSIKRAIDANHRTLQPHEAVVSPFGDVSFENLISYRLTSQQSD
jgi:hypothetical protein